ncbi:hypothetical protein L195_g022953, partial [Trifolium pratense]
MMLLRCHCCHQEDTFIKRLEASFGKSNSDSAGGLEVYPFHVLHTLKGYSSISERNDELNKGYLASPLVADSPHQSRRRGRTRCERIASVRSLISGRIGVEDIKSEGTEARNRKGEILIEKPRHFSSGLIQSSISRFAPLALLLSIPVQDLIERATASSNSIAKDIHPATQSSLFHSFKASFKLRRLLS